MSSTNYKNYVKYDRRRGNCESVQDFSSSSMYPFFWGHCIIFIEVPPHIPNYCTETQFLPYYAALDPAQCMEEGRLGSFRALLLILPLSHSARRCAIEDARYDVKPTAALSCWHSLLWRCYDATNANSSKKGPCRVLMWRQRFLFLDRVADRRISKI